ncbi:MAG: hypothetical protein HOO87_17665 [Methyloglobulus sp.]|nr:hypothetical protein [Methyloglobulus sp.]
MRLALVVWVSALLLLTSSVVAAEEESSKGYQLGRGYAIGNTGIRLGGYASVHLESLGDVPWSLNVSDASLFVAWDNGSRLRFFSELEVEDSLGAGQQYRGVTTSKADFLIERLYLDYLVNDNLTVRIGKILTPVGQWNLIHADPLVWTATRPVATDNLFSEHVSGIMLHGTVPIGEQSLEYSVYGDYSSTLDPLRAEPPYFDNALGMHLRYNVNDNLKIGFSYVDFALQGSANIRNHLAGLDIAWAYQRFAVNSEIVYRNNDAAVNNNAWQGYIQGVSPIAEHFYAVGRYEFFDQPNQQFGQVGVLGIAYRPRPPLTLKLEYRLGQHNRDLAPDGLFASFSVLF